MIAHAVGIPSKEKNDEGDQKDSGEQENDHLFDFVGAGIPSVE